MNSARRRSRARATGRMPAAKRLRRIRIKAPGVWERGYLCHVYWKGAKKLAVIRLGPAATWDRAYRWECLEANVRGASMSLVNAKRTVEAIILTGCIQLDLFDGI